MFLFHKFYFNRMTSDKCNYFLFFEILYMLYVSLKNTLIFKVDSLKSFKDFNLPLRDFLVTPHDAVLDVYRMVAHTPQ